MAVRLKGLALRTLGTLNIRGGGDINEPPTDIILSGDVLLERSPQGTTVGYLTAVDPNPSDTHTFELIDDAGGRFQIVGNQLQAGPVMAVEEEASSHVIVIRVTDNRGLSFTKEFTVLVAHDNKAPTDILLSSNTVTENSAEGTVIGVLSAIDPDDSDGFTFSLISTLGQRFKIVGNELQTGRTPLDYEEAAVYTLSIRVMDDEGASFIKTFDIHVIDVNEEPTDITLSHNVVDEFSEPGYTIGVLGTTDPDREETFTYELLTTAGGRFKIVGNELQTDTTPITFADGSSYNLTIRVTDSAGHTFVKSFTIYVNTAPVNITLTSNTVNERSPRGTQIGYFSTIDPDGLSKTYTYTLIDDAGGRFYVSGKSLYVGGDLDYETNPTHQITVRSTDSEGLTVDKTFTIIIRDVPEPPYDILLSSTAVVENSPEGTLIGYLQALDQDAVGNTFTYNIYYGSTKHFKIVGNELQCGPTPTDYEAVKSHVIGITATDATGRSFNKVFTITVLDANEPPSNISLNGSRIAERSVQGTVVGTLTATDPDEGDDTFTFELVDDLGGLFQIVGNELQAGPNPTDYVTANTHTVQIKVTDSGGLSLIKSFSISVIRVWRPATDIILDGNAIEENSPSNVLIGRLYAVDPDIGDHHTFSLIGWGSSSGYDTKLKIVGNELYSNTTPFDYEKDNPFYVTVRATDSGGKTYDKTFVINIIDENEVPTNIVFSGSTLPERSPQGTLVSTMTTVDPDVDDTHTYTLVDDFGGVFQITDNRLEAGPTPANGYTNPSYTVSVISTDSGGLSYQRSLTVRVPRVWRAPTDIQLSSYEVLENSRNGTLIGTLTAIDPDEGDQFTYSLVSPGSSSGYSSKLRISGDELLCNTTPFNFEADPNPFMVTIRVTDKGNNQFTKTLALNILDVNEVPTNITLIPNNAVDEGTAEGFLIGNLSVVDPDNEDTHTFELIDDLGGRLKIVGNQLMTGPVPFDYEELTANPVIQVRATDSGGLSFTRPFTIYVRNVNEAPTDIILDTTKIADSPFPNRPLATISYVDPDSVRTTQTITYTLDDDSDGHFAISGSNLTSTTKPLDADTTSEHTITIRATDQGGLFVTKTFNILIRKTIVPYHVDHYYVYERGNSFSIPYPGNFQAGDLLLLYYVGYGQANGKSGPKISVISDADWNVTDTVYGVWGGYSLSAAFAYKIADGSEEGSISLNANGTVDMNGSIHVYRNVNEDVPIRSFLRYNQREFDIVGVQPSNSNQMLLVFGNHRTNFTDQAPPSPWNNIINGYNAFTWYLVSEVQMTENKVYSLRRTTSATTPSSAVSVIINPKVIE